MIGEYLGDGDKKVMEVMYAYVDSMNFAGMDFVTALRCVSGRVVSLSHRVSSAFRPVFARTGRISVWMKGFRFTGT